MPTALIVLIFCASPDAGVCNKTWASDPTGCSYEMGELKTIESGHLTMYGSTVKARAACGETVRFCGEQRVCACDADRPKDPQGPAQFSLGEFEVLARRWMYEMIVAPAESCLNKSGSASFSLSLNSHGEVSVSFRSASSMALMNCIEFFVARAPFFDTSATSVLVDFELPSHAEIPRRRAPKMAGLACAKHEECGAGQACIHVPGEQTAGGADGRCLDLQRWLASKH